MRRAYELEIYNDFDLQPIKQHILKPAIIKLLCACCCLITQIARLHHMYLIMYVIKSQADHNGIRLMHIVIKMARYTAMMPEEKSLVRGIVLINVLSAHCSLQYSERTLYWCPTYLAQRDFWIVMDACLYKIVSESTIRMRMSEMGGNSYNPGCIFFRFIKQIVFIGVVIYETHLSTMSLYIITWVMGILLSYHFGNLFKIDYWPRNWSHYCALDLSFKEKHLISNYFM